MMLSVMPSVRYSIRGSAPAFTNGRTASDLPRVRVLRDAVVCEEPDSSARSAIARSCADSNRRRGSRSIERATIARSSGGASGSNAPRVGQAVVQQPRDDFLRRAAGEQLPPGQHLVEHAAEREDVAPTVDALTLHLLRRHVSERAEHDAAEPCAAIVGLSPRAFRLSETLQGETEVEDLHRAVGGAGTRSPA